MNDFKLKSHDINVFIRGTRGVIQKLKIDALEREENLKKSEELAKFEQEKGKKFSFVQICMTIFVKDFQI